MSHEVNVNETRPADPATMDAEQVAALQQERDDLHDRLLRLTAEFDNYRKRTDRERRDLAQAAASDLMLDVLPVVDDLERALGAAGEGGGASVEGLRQGVALIHRQLLEVLRRRGVEPLEVLGHDFDPAWHEAVAHEPAAGHREGEITAEIRRGYRLGDRLLRPAMVKVAKA
ncbi:MAG: nucleotide exchange factor GrpE [Vicinamibacterales bacterium]